MKLSTPLDKIAVSVLYSKSLEPVISPSSRVLDGKRLVTIITPRSALRSLNFLKQEETDENAYLHRLLEFSTRH